MIFRVYIYRETSIELQSKLKGKLFYNTEVQCKLVSSKLLFEVVIKNVQNVLAIIQTRTFCF